MTAESCQAGRLRLSWVIEPVTGGITSRWAINAGGQPALELHWGARRRRHVASLWVRPSHGPRDERLARDAFLTGPLEEHSIDWRVTWHTWDRDGVGGENADDRDLATALESTLIALLRQGWIPGLRAAEVGQLFGSVSILAGEWLESRRLCSVRWAYSG